jgi:microsomal dipeptidase-like Zn-dependent dipeptidase
MIGGLFAVAAMPEDPPEGDLTITKASYEVRLADPLDPAYARRQIAAQLDGLARLEARASGQIRRAVSVDDIAAGQREGKFVIVRHMEGAEAIGPDLEELDTYTQAGCALSVLFGAVPTSSATACRSPTRARPTSGLALPRWAKSWFEDATVSES